MFVDFAVSKVCSGTMADSPKSGGDQDHYNSLKEQFINCNYVKNNIEIHAMRSLRNVSLDFFHGITEVSGYVRIQGVLPQGITKLPFPNLAIVRGETLTKYRDDGENEYSFFLFNANQITDLNLHSLKGIL